MRYLTVVAVLEMALAALLTLAALDALSSADEWAPLVLTITAPLAVSLWLTGIALLRSWRTRWVLHAVPPSLVLCAWLLLLWLDHGVRMEATGLRTLPDSHTDFVLSIVRRRN